MELGVFIISLALSILITLIALTIIYIFCIFIFERAKTRVKNSLRFNCKDNRVKLNEIELRTIKEKYTLKPEPPETFDFIRKIAIEKKISEFNMNFRNGLVKIKNFDLRFC
jgi:hypothetical protein